MMADKNPHGFQWTPSVKVPLTEEGKMNFAYQKWLLLEINRDSETASSEKKEFNKILDTKRKIEAKKTEILEKLEAKGEIEKDDPEKVELEKISTELDEIILFYNAQKDKLLQYLVNLRSMVDEMRDPIFWIFPTVKKEGGFSCAEEANIRYALQFGNWDHAPASLRDFEPTRNNTKKLIGSLTSL